MLKVLLPQRTHSKNTNIAKHQHEYYELVYFTNGHVRTNINGTDYDITNNTLVLYSPHVVHDEFYYEKSSSVVFGYDLNVSFNLNDYLVIKDHDLVFENYVNELLQEFNSPDTYSKTLIDIVIYKIMVQIARNYSLKCKTGRDIDSIISYIDKFFTAKLQINDLAQKTFYSPGHFRALFKQKTGILPKDYILKKRLQLAENMLIYSDTTLTVIAETCGFENYSQFSLFFKRKNGLSPIRYRNQNAIKNK